MATRSVIAFPKERAVYELGGLQPSDLAKLLNRLTDQLLLQGRIDTAMTRDPFHVACGDDRFTWSHTWCLSG